MCPGKARVSGQPGIANSGNQEITAGSSGRYGSNFTLPNSGEDRPIQCFNCQGFGHFKKDCSSPSLN